MGSRGRRFAMAGLVGCVALGALAFAMRRDHPAPISYIYPPNARQLIAAGLSGRPSGLHTIGPLTLDLVLVDGTQTTILYHVANTGPGTGAGPLMPSLALSDDRGQSYLPRQGGQSGSGFAMTPRPAGWQGVLWDLLRVLPLFGANQPARGYATYDPLSLRAHAAVISVKVQGSTGIVRVPLRLGALRATTISVAFRRRVSGSGAVVTLTRVVRVPGSAEIDYTVDAPGTNVNAGVIDLRGHQLATTGGYGRCASSPAPSMHCDMTMTFAPPRRGTPLRFIVTMPPSLRLTVPFRMP